MPFFKFCLVFISMMFLSLAQASLYRGKSMNLNMKLGFAGDYVEDTQIKARTWGTAFLFDYQYRFNKFLTADIDANVYLETGSSSSLNVNEFAPSQNINLNHAALTVEPLNDLFFEFGSLDQGIYESPLLLTNTSFMGTRQKYSFNPILNFVLYASMEQTIPHNNELNTRVGTVQEGTPAFFMETLGLKMPGDIVSADFSFGQFAYQNLSSNVAYNSGLMGNTSGGSGSDASYFLYKFKGYTARGKISFGLSSNLKLDFNGQYLFNDKAPDNLNTGTLVGTTLTWNSFIVGGEILKNQKDSSPAYYNSKYYGHNNKKGQSYFLGLQFDDWKINLRYADLKIIRPTLYQADTKMVTFKMEKSL